MWFDKVWGLPVWFWAALFVISIVLLLMSKTLLGAFFQGSLVFLAFFALLSYFCIDPDDFKF